jgi:hypothetical protein
VVLVEMVNGIDLRASWYQVISNKNRRVIVVFRIYRRARRFDVYSTKPAPTTLIQGEMNEIAGSWWSCL